MAAAVPARPRRRLEVSPPPPTVRLKFQHYRKQLQIQSSRINLVEVTGHDGIYGNELADQHSRDMSKMIAYGNISAPSNITTD